MADGILADQTYIVTHGFYKQAMRARAEAVLGSLRGLRVAVLGASYRGKVKETAFSGVFGTVAALEERGATVLVHDPMYDDARLACESIRFGATYSRPLNKFLSQPPL